MGEAALSDIEQQFNQWSINGKPTTIQAGDRCTIIPDERIVTFWRPTALDKGFSFGPPLYHKSSQMGFEVGHVEPGNLQEMIAFAEYVTGLNLEYKYKKKGSCMYSMTDPNAPAD